MSARGGNIDPRTVLITGLPRSGTTLTCELLGSLPDTVALDEPLDRTHLLGPDRSEGPKESGLGRVVTRLRADRAHPSHRAAAPAPEDVCRRVDKFIEDTRSSALTRGMVRTKSTGGRVIGKKVSDERDADGLRLRLVSVGEIPVDKALTPNFLLAIKQCGGFTAVLETLVEHHPVYALVRNPLAVLRSWHSVPMNVREGHIPLAERMNPALARELAAISDVVDRQFHLLEWFFGAFARLLPRSSVISYEEVIASQGRALCPISADARILDVPLADGNRGSARPQDAAVVAGLGQRLLETDGSWWEFYSPAEVKELMDAAI